MQSGTPGRASQLVAKCVFLIVGLVFFVGALISAYRTHAFLRTCVTAQGRIAGFKPVHSSRRNSTTYAPVFRFDVPGTHFATVVSHTSSNPPAFTVGEAVTVRYPTGHPEQALIDSFGQLWLMDWAFGGIGALIFGIGLLTLLYRQRGKRREPALSNDGSGITRL